MIYSNVKTSSFYYLATQHRHTITHGLPIYVSMCLTADSDIRAKFRIAVVKIEVKSALLFLCLSHRVCLTCRRR